MTKKRNIKTDKAAKVSDNPTAMEATGVASAQEATTAPAGNVVQAASPENETKEEAVVRLAALADTSLMEYDRVREQEAERLGIRLSTLDKEVKKLTAGDSSGGGDILEFDTPEPWHEPVNIGEVLDELTSTISRFIILPPHAVEAIVLWIVFTYVIDLFQCAPILAILSPTKRCGKTTLISLLTKLVYHPLVSSSISTSAIFRTISMYKITMMIDEADSFIHMSEEMRGVLNSGHTRDAAYVIRCIVVANNFEPRRFITWGPKVLALIGKLPETLHDRSIAINLRRRLPDEVIEKMCDVDPAKFNDLQSKLIRFANDNAEALQQVRPDVPKELSDRAADNWRPLLAIATLAGDAWLNKAKKAALALSGADQEAVNHSVELLADIKEVFENYPEHKKGRIPTSELISVLCQDSEKPWATYNKGVEPQIKPRQLAGLLKDFGIASKNAGFDEKVSQKRKVVKAYEWAQFTEAFARYLPPPPPVTSATTLQNDDSIVKTESSTVADNKKPKPRPKTSATPKKRRNP